MSTLRRRVEMGILLIFLLGCASSPTDQRTIDLKQRIEFGGISVLPPQAKNWMLGASPWKGIVFKKRFSESLEEPETYTLLAGVRTTDLHEKELRNPQDLLAFIESALSSKEDVRFRNISTRVLLDENRSKAMNTDCAQYEFVTKESANPLFPGMVFLLTTYGFQCRHPYAASIVVDAFCTERYQENNQPVNKAYKNECAAFLNEVQFKPLGSQIDGLMDTTYLKVPAWNYPQWQQMVSAAKMINEQGNKSGAEQLCHQALHFADANTIKSLYAYADLLEAQKRDRSILVRARANKLLELRIKQAIASRTQITYLGFLSEEMLSEYADSLDRLQRTTEAESIRALGQAYRYTQEVYAVRLRIMNQEGDAQGVCIGFQDQAR